MKSIGVNKYIKETLLTKKDIHVISCVTLWFPQDGHQGFSVFSIDF